MAYQKIPKASSYNTGFAYNYLEEKESNWGFVCRLGESAASYQLDADSEIAEIVQTIEKCRIAPCCIAYRMGYIW